MFKYGIFRYTASAIALVYRYKTAGSLRTEMFLQNIWTVNVMRNILPENHVEVSIQEIIENPQLFPQTGYYEEVLKEFT